MKQPHLTIYNGENVVDRLEFAGLYQAIKYVKETQHPTAYSFVFSTFNETHVENTINIQKPIKF